MATWIAHIIIAENLLKKYNFERKSFLIGSIAPDSGIPNEDRSGFDPSKKITHWINEDGIIAAETFYDKYISHKISIEDKNK